MPENLPTPVTPQYVRYWDSGSTSKPGDRPVRPDLVVSAVGQTGRRQSLGVRLPSPSLLEDACWCLWSWRHARRQRQLPHDLGRRIRVAPALAVGAGRSVVRDRYECWVFTGGVIPSGTTPSYLRGGGTFANRASSSFILLGSFGVSTFPDMIRMPRPSFSTRKVVRTFSVSLRSITTNQQVGALVPGKLINS